MLDVRIVSLTNVNFYICYTFSNSYSKFAGSLLELMYWLAGQGQAQVKLGLRESLIWTTFLCCYVEKSELDM